MATRDCRRLPVVLYGFLWLPEIVDCYQWFCMVISGLHMALEVLSREISGPCDAAGVEAGCGWNGSIGSSSSSDKSYGTSLMANCAAMAAVQHNFDAPMFIHVAA